MKKIILLITIIAMLTLTACSSGGGGNVPATNFKTFIGGTEGVSVSFEQDTPPAEVNAGDPFKVVVKLENKGEHTIPPEDYFVTLKGFSPEAFGVTLQELTVGGEEELAANVLDPDTGSTIESYPVYIEIPKNKDLVYQGGIAGNTPFTLFTDVCYTYETTANAKLCIKEDLQKTTDDKVCTITGPKDISSSGAPVTIGGFEESGSGREAVRFQFTISQADNQGTVHRPESKCSTDYKDDGVVYVEVETGMAGELDCNGFSEETSPSSGYLKLSGGSRTITCKQTVNEGERGDYVTTVIIKARYDFEKSAEKEILIKKPLE